MMIKDRTTEREHKIRKVNGQRDRMRDRVKESQTKNYCQAEILELER